MESNSKRFRLNSIDYKKIGIGALVALGGALLTYIAQFISDVDFGQHTYWIVPTISILINIGRKFLASYEQPESQENL